MTGPLQHNTRFLAMAQLMKAGLKIIAASIYACFAASFFSGIVLFIPFLFFCGFVVLFIFFVTSFVMGLPAFLMVGVPVLHWIPALKSARPREAALAGAVSAAIVDCYILLGWLFPGSDPFFEICAAIFRIHHCLGGLRWLAVSARLKTA